jgi:uncharacterized protein
MAQVSVGRVPSRGALLRIPIPALKKTRKGKFMANQCVWFDIPVVDLDRAIKFYSELLGEPITKKQHPGMTFGLLPHKGEEVGGCLVVMEKVKPSAQGPLLYLNAQGRLDAALTAAQANGGKIFGAKTSNRPLRFPRDCPRQRRQPHRAAFEVRREEVDRSTPFCFEQKSTTAKRPGSA